MKHIIVFLAVVLITTDCSRDKPKNDKVSNDTTTSDLQMETSEIILKEEFPPAKTCKINLGKLKMSDDGYSIGKQTELTELLKQLKDKNCDIIEIIYVWKTPPYDDMPMKILYNRREGNLKEIYTRRNVIEDYANINEACLSSFLKNGEKYFESLSDYCKDAKHDFNNREMNQTAVGSKPEQSEFDGTVAIVKDYIKRNAKDASSIEFLEWSKVSPLGENWIVRCKHKGTNSFGAVVSENTWYYIQNSRAVDTKLIE